MDILYVILTLLECFSHGNNDQESTSELKCRKCTCAPYHRTFETAKKLNIFGKLYLSKPNSKLFDNMAIKAC